METHYNLELLHGSDTMLSTVVTPTHLTGLQDAWIAWLNGRQDVRSFPFNARYRDTGREFSIIIDLAEISAILTSPFEAPPTPWGG